MTPQQGPRPLRGELRRISARLARRLPHPPYGTAPLPDARGRPVPQPLVRITLLAARFLTLVERPDVAQRVLGLVLRFGPSCEPLLIAAGDAARAGGPVGLVSRPVIGLSSGYLGDAATAENLYRRAMTLRGPARDAAQRGLARALLLGGRFDDAAAIADEITTGSAASHQAIAAVADQTGRARGAHRRDEAQRMVREWSASLELAPADGVTRHRLVRHLVLIGRFADARAVAYDRADPDVIAGPALEMIQAGHDAADNTDWLFAVHAELVACGDPAASHAVKRRIAALTRDALDRRALPVSQIVQRVQATSYLSGAVVAIDELARHRVRFATDVERRTLDKLHADLELSAGCTRRLRRVLTELTDARPRPHPTTEPLVRGRRVLVVGPSNTEPPDRAMLADFDVVVATKRPASDVGGISAAYLTDASARLNQRDLARDLERDQDRHLVLRPSMIGPRGQQLPRHPRVHVMQCEDANTFLGTRFGIQRILYDLVGSGAGEVVLAGTDFFLSDEPYRPGYTTEIEEIFDPRGLQPIRSISPHDHLWDFAFTRTLRDAGLVACLPAIDLLLDMSDDEYNDRLGRHLRNGIRESGDGRTDPVASPTDSGAIRNQ